MPDELNDYFSSIAISTAPSDGFSFLPVSEADVILAVSHFKTEAKEKDGIPQGIVSKVLRVIAHFLTILFNTSLANGVFYQLGRKRGSFY